MPSTWCTQAVLVLALASGAPASVAQQPPAEPAPGAEPASTGATQDGQAPATSDNSPPPAPGEASPPASTSEAADDPAADAMLLPDEAELAFVQGVITALHDGDADALGQLVDFPRRFDELLQHGRREGGWDDLDPREQVVQRQLIGRLWAGSDEAFLGDATLQKLVRLEDPEAGTGAVPDRRILQAVLHNHATGARRDLVIVATPELAVLDLQFGPRYFGDKNPAGAAGLQPVRGFAVAEWPVVRWPEAVTDAEREAARTLVTQLLAAAPGEERNLLVGRLRVQPHATAAALVERLDALDREAPPDAEAQEQLALCLEYLTGRSADVLGVQPDDLDELGWRELNQRAVLAWLKWYAREGASYSVASSDATVAAAPPAGDAGEEIPGERRARQEREAGGAAAGTGGAASGAGSAGSGAGGAAASGGDSGAAPDAGAEEAGGPKVTLPPPSAPPTARDLLYPAAANLKLRFGPDDVTGRDVEAQLAPSLKEALNAWAQTVGQLGLRVCLSGNPEHIVLGAASPEALAQAAATMDEAFALLDPLVPFVAGREPRATVAIVFDEEGARSPAWRGVLDELVARKLVFESAAEGLRDAPAGLMLRGSGVFLQTTYDVAGNAAEGDDEFRLRNEVLHKFTQCLLTERLGQLPPAFLWGLGELVEVQLTQSVYMFNTTGFVASADHFDWPRRAAQYLVKRKQKRSATLSSDAMQDAVAGQAVEAQMTVWAALAWLAAHEPATLRDLLLELAELHAEADPRQRAAVYRGDAERTRAVLAARLDALDRTALIHWLEGSP